MPDAPPARPAVRPVHCAAHLPPADDRFRISWCAGWRKVCSEASCIVKIGLGAGMTQRPEASASARFLQNASQAGIARHLRQACSGDGRIENRKGAALSHCALGLSGQVTIAHSLARLAEVVCCPSLGGRQVEFGIGRAADRSDEQFEAGRAPQLVRPALSRERGHDQLRCPLDPPAKPQPIIVPRHDPRGNARYRICRIGRVDDKFVRFQSPLHLLARRST